jgi:hypothetical protein
MLAGSVHRAQHLQGRDAGPGTPEPAATTYFTGGPMAGFSAGGVLPHARYPLVA